MPVENANYISELDQSLPQDGGMVFEGDDHFRMLKSVLKASFPNIDQAMTATAVELNELAEFKDDLISLKDEFTGDNLLLKEFLTDPAAVLDPAEPDAVKLPVADKTLQTDLNAEYWGGRKVHIDTTVPDAADGEDGDLWFVRSTEAL